MPLVSAGLDIEPIHLGQARLVYLQAFPFARQLHVSQSVWWAVMERDVVTSYAPAAWRGRNPLVRLDAPASLHQHPATRWTLR